MKKFFTNIYLALILLFIYVPITVLIIFSFNEKESLSSFAGASLNWYKKVGEDRSLIESIISSLLVATVSTIIAVVIGTLAAIGLSKSKKVTRNLTLSISNIPIINADIITAASLMMLFFSLGFNFGIFSLILAHISFNIPYAIITILPRLQKVRNELVEASLDLGASPWYTLRKIILPLIRPAIIGATAICFAMSFDDFIISYFTGGSTTNVATYIYTLRRIKPTIAAFGTILIAIVSFIIITWNGFNFIKKIISSRNEKILKGKYFDRKLVKLEKLLSNYYLKLNNLEKRMNYESDEWLITKICDLENKIVIEKNWLVTIKNKIIEKNSTKQKVRERLRKKYYWLVRIPWRLITIMALAFGSIGLLTAMYLKYNSYDLKIGIWSEYLKDSTIQKFEKEYDVRVKKEEYDSNEMLYAKMATTNYDLVVPSDYMLIKLVREGRIEKLDLSRLKMLDEEGNESAIKVVDAMNKNILELIQDVEIDDATLSDYGIPYFWGDLTLVFNFENPEIKDWLRKYNVEWYEENNRIYIQEATLSWEIVLKAALDGKKVFLNNDIKNLYAIAFQILYQTVSPLKGSEQKASIDAAVELLEQIIVNNKSNVTLQNDEIIDTVRTQKFDLAFMYNGEAAATFLNSADEVEKRQFAVARPRKIAGNGKSEGTGIWIDIIGLTKNSNNKDLAYKFIQFLMREDIQVGLSSEVGYTSVIQNAIEQLTNVNGEFENIAQVFLPTAVRDNTRKTWKIANRNIDNTNDEIFSDAGLEYLVDQYNRRILSR